MSNSDRAITVIIADDHEVYRDGLRLMLSKAPNINVIDEAANGIQLLDCIKQKEPDIVLSDIVMPVMDGITAVKRISVLYPSIGIIALSMFDEEHYITDMLEAGALGYLLKNADKADIIEAVKTVYSHNPYYCRLTSAKLARIISRSKFNPYLNKSATVFADKEKQIIQLICMEKTNKEIAQELYLSTRTVEGYRSRIQEKMNVKSTAGIVVYAIKNGIYKYGE